MEQSNALPPRPLVVGLPGPRLDDKTREALKNLRPTGFILMGRNIETPEQTKALCHELYQHSPYIFIDQEGGRVQRIRWNGFTAPAAATFGALYKLDAKKGLRAAYLNGLVQSARLASVGVTVNCAPCADVLNTHHDIVGDRAFSSNGQTVALLAQETSKGMMEGGVLPVIKHAPGHGRAHADSHLELPVVTAPLEELEENDFLPFKHNKDIPFVMTAHILYPILNARNPATTSPSILALLRQQWKMSGVFITDDIMMDALAGDAFFRAREALSAGCNLVLYSGTKMGRERNRDIVDDYFETIEKFMELPPISLETQSRLMKIPTLNKPDEEKVKAAEAELQKLLA